MLRFTHLTTGYGRKTIGNDLSAHLPKGRLVALLGGNGAGKSTLLRTLAGFQPPLTTPSVSETGIWLDGKDLKNYSARELARKLSVVLTFKPEADALTVWDVVQAGRIPHQKLLTGTNKADVQAVEQALALTNTQRFAQRELCTLSDGERQRVFIAKALAQETPVILLDEPSAFLDFPSKIQLFRLLLSLAHEAGKSILLSTHDVEMALEFADQLWLLSSHGIQAGTTAELAQQGALDRCFAAADVRFDTKSGRFIYEREKNNTPHVTSSQQPDNSFITTP